jgi:hypothetical protein
LSSFWLTLKQQWTIKIASPLFSILSLVSPSSVCQHFTFYTSPQKPLDQLQPNFGGKKGGKKLKKNLLLGNYWANINQTLLKWFLDDPLPKLCGFRGEVLNVIFYQNMPNLHNRYISAERKISQKNPNYMLNFSLPCSCS